MLQRASSKDKVKQQQQQQPSPGSELVQLNAVPAETHTSGHQQQQQQPLADRAGNEKQLPRVCKNFFRRKQPSRHAETLSKQAESGSAGSLCMRTQRR